MFGKVFQYSIGDRNHFRVVTALEIVGDVNNPCASCSNRDAVVQNTENLLFNATFRNMQRNVKCLDAVPIVDET